MNDLSAPAKAMFEPVTTNTTSAHIGTSAASNGVSLLPAAAATVGVRGAWASHGGERRRQSCTEQEHTCLSSFSHLARKRRHWLRTYQFKKYSPRRIVTEFLKINCKTEELDTYVKNIRETRSTDHRCKSGRSKHARTEKKVATVNELISLLNQEGQKQTLRSARQISRETGLTQCSIIQWFTAILVRSVFRLPTRLVLTFFTLIFHKVV